MRIAVAMSGGVDSAVAALLLHRQGAEVVGLSMQLVDHGEGGRVGRCCSGQDLEDAQRAAWTIGIPHYVLDFEEIFAARVKRPFVDAYLRGETPIPCLECNTEVKFAPLLARARALGCERIATGHYARVVADDGAPRLARARDRAKDQTYFLYELGPEILERVVFPLGELVKDEVRELAREAGLPVADKAESQEICFVPPGRRYDQVVDAERPAAPEEERAGRFEDTAGHDLGAHDGFHRFTVGQRRGLGIGFGERRYVIEVRPADRAVVLGSREELLTEVLDLRDLRWWGPDGGAACRVQLRHRGHELEARVELGEEGSGRVRFERPVASTAPGQAIVAYGGELVLGGGRVAVSAPASAAAASSSSART